MEQLIGRCNKMPGSIIWLENSNGVREGQGRLGQYGSRIVCQGQWWPHTILAIRTHNFWKNIVSCGMLFQKTFCLASKIWGGAGDSWMSPWLVKMFSRLWRILMPYVFRLYWRGFLQTKTNNTPLSVKMQERFWLQDWISNNARECSCCAGFDLNSW